MRALDTNVLVRYLVADEPRQLAAAERVIEESRESQDPLFLSAIVLCELAWVLARTYGQTKPAIVEDLELILDREQFEIEHHALVRRSLESYRHGKGSFSDYLIGEIGQHAGCRDTVTFDRALRGAAGFTLLP
jgi:predicted nucleic-acid-binding protein